MPISPGGLPTGIGSLPHLDAATAVSLVKKYFPAVPHWPQLPMANKREYFTHQFLQLLLDLGLLRVERETCASFTCDDPEWPDRLAAFYDIYLQASAGYDAALDRFAFPAGAADGWYRFYNELEKQGTGGARFLKGQIVGLLSAGFQVTDPQGCPAYYDPQLRDVLLKQLSLQAAWQARLLGRFGLPVLIFMDDPVINSCGMSDRIGVDRGEVIAELNEFASFVRSVGGLAGVHTCAELDWSLLLETEMDVISFDAYQYASGFILFPEQIRSFLERSGVIAWGMIPTIHSGGKALAEENLESLQARTRQLLQKLERKAVDLRLVQSQSLVTPACGTGMLSESEAERAYELTASLAASWDGLFACSFERR
ncbi:MAG: hypothetical protein ABSC17_11115 [Thermacetogeniaceae bacterium]